MNTLFLAVAYGRVSRGVLTLLALSLGGKKMKKKKPNFVQKNSFDKELTSTSKNALRQFKSARYATQPALASMPISGGRSLHPVKNRGEVLLRL